MKLRGWLSENSLWPAPLVIALVILLFPPPSRAQRQTDDPAFFAANQGFVNGSDEEGTEWMFLRIPINITLKSWRDGYVNERLGLRLRLAGTFAIKDFPGPINTGNIPDALESAKMVALIPGLEFVIPLGPSSMLRPWFDIGVGDDNRTDAATLLGTIGIRTEFIFDTASRNWLYGLEPGFQLGANTHEILDDSVLVNPFFTASARRMLGFEISGFQPDLGGYFEFGFDFKGLEFSTVETSGESIARRYEIGLGMGFSRGRPKIFGLFYVPRVSVGYRFGDVTGWRIRIGGDWLTLLTPEDTGVFN